MRIGLILLDLMLPGEDGRPALPRRCAESDVPTIAADLPGDEVDAAVSSSTPTTA